MKIKEIKKVSARLLANGRATLIHSEADYDFNKLPIGSILINNDNNKIKIKLEDKSTWSDIKEEMSSRSYLTILGNRILQEPFLVTDIDLEKNEITYYNHRGERRIKYIYTDKKWKYAVFELDKATYTPKKNAIVAHINNIVECNTENYKLQEITPRRIGIDIRWLAVGCWVDIAYYDIFRMRSVGREIFAGSTNDKIKNNSMGLVYDNLDKEGYPRLHVEVIEDPSDPNQVILRVTSENGSTISVSDVQHLLDKTNRVKVIENNGKVDFIYRRVSQEYTTTITSTKPGKIKEMFTVKIPKRGEVKIFKFIFMFGKSQFKKIRKIVPKKIITPEPELILGTGIVEREKTIVTSSDTINVKPEGPKCEVEFFGNDYKVYLLGKLYYDSDSGEPEEGSHPIWSSIYPPAGDLFFRIGKCDGWRIESSPVNGFYLNNNSEYGMVRYQGNSELDPQLFSWAENEKIKVNAVPYKIYQYDTLRYSGIFYYILLRNKDNLDNSKFKYRITKEELRQAGIEEELINKIYERILSYSESEEEMRRREQEEADRRRREEEEARRRREQEEADRRQREQELSNIRNLILPILRQMKEKFPQKIDQLEGVSSTEKEKLKQKIDDYYNKIIAGVNSTNDISKLNSIKELVKDVNPFHDRIEFTAIKTNKLLEILGLSGSVEIPNENLGNNSESNNDADSEKKKTEIQDIFDRIIEDIRYDNYILNKDKQNHIDQISKLKSQVLNRYNSPIKKIDRYLIYMNIIHLKIFYEKENLNATIEEMNSIINKFNFSGHISSIEYISR